jgi:DNA-binding Lrp family transcriptional regulator
MIAYMRRNKALPQSSLAKLDKDIFNYSSKQVLKLLDNTNVKIISELVREPNISSLALAEKLDVPLSTLQRRRARVEKDILKKMYAFNYKAFGGRVGDLVICIDKDRSKEVARSLLKKYKNNITSCHTRIDSMHNVSAHVIFKDTDELYRLIESIKNMEYVTGVAWSETVEVIGDNNPGVISGFFNNKSN